VNRASRVRGVARAAFLCLTLPFAVASCRGEPHGGSAHSATIAVTRAVVPASPSPSEASAFMVIENLGETADSLTAVSSPDADTVLIHEMTSGRMAVAADIPIEPGGRVRLVPGGYHLMFHGLSRQAQAGDTLTLTLHFARAGALDVRAPVLRYSEAVETATAGSP
jgi:copper(I)-binding protein